MRVKSWQNNRDLGEGVVRQLRFGLTILITLGLLASASYAEKFTAPDGTKFTVPGGFKKTGGMGTKSGFYSASWMNESKKWSMSVKIEPKFGVSAPVDKLKKEREKLAKKYKMKSVKIPGAVDAFTGESKKKRDKFILRAASEEALLELEFGLIRVDTKKYGPEFRKMAGKVIKSVKMAPAKK